MGMPGGRLIEMMLRNLVEMLFIFDCSCVLSTAMAKIDTHTAVRMGVHHCLPRADFVAQHFVSEQLGAANCQRIFCQR